MRLSRAVVACLLACLALVAAPGLAGAQVATLAEGKTLCDSAITKRLTDLAAARRLLDAATHVAASDRTALDGQIDSASGGLTTLKRTVDADTTLRQLRIDCRMIVTTYRVYLVLIPKVHMVVAADRVLAASAALNNVATLVQGKIAAGGGATPGGAQAALTDLIAKAAAAQATAGGIPGELLPLTASGYPGNRPTLLAARASLATAQTDLAAALADAKTIQAALR